MGILVDSYYQFAEVFCGDALKHNHHSGPGNMIAINSYIFYFPAVKKPNRRNNKMTNWVNKIYPKENHHLLVNFFRTRKHIGYLFVTSSI